MFFILGRKGLEPSTANSYWVYSSTRKPTYGPFLFNNLLSKKLIDSYLLILHYYLVVKTMSLFY